MNNEGTRLAAFCALLGCTGACVTNDDPAEDTEQAGTTGQATTAVSTTGEGTDAQTTSGESAADSGESSGSESGSESGSGSTTGGPPAFEHCDDTPPLPDSDMVSGAWADVEGDATLSPGVIDAPAGGYVTATLAPGAARGAIEVTANGNVADAVEGDPGDDVTVGFLAAPNVSYSMLGRQAASAPAYPTTWVFSWEATAIPDCWEPNQTPAQAAPIALDAPIRGYMNAGYESGDEPDSEAYWDYFQIDIDAPGVMNVSMDQVPSDGLLRIAVFDAADEGIGPLIGVETMGQTFSGTVPIIEAGTYYVRVYQLVAPTLRFGDDGEIPESWTVPYTFTLGFTAD